jgi:hypothetical protein
MESKVSRNAIIQVPLILTLNRLPRWSRSRRLFDSHKVPRPSVQPRGNSAAPPSIRAVVLKTY